MEECRYPVMMCAMLCGASHAPEVQPKPRPETEVWSDPYPWAPPMVSAMMSS